ncbi:MAG: bifunctional phosphopantothenoylcysteine decarboxylase/phosphopantothenate--cysteine ligase CoaBC [Alphaproteobacteria bacterium]|nr:bifunctional phosphopantothenoylcysteine decarboxylase/phosphopantothenate--cysteine ligase CoaBC [Alphaproteobacteria bacterium]
MSKQNILIGITGSIAAIKSLDIITSLKKKGYNIKCLITKSGEQFIDLNKFPLPKEDIFLSRDENQKYLKKQDAHMEHIDLAKWANIILIVPASANIISKISCGIADDSLSSTCLASEAKIILVPAMNKVMWNKKTTQESIKKVINLGVKILGPAYGEQACGDFGYGRMIEPKDILENITLYLENRQKLKGKKFIITAGPTQEPIDPVRYISNRSSGKMGYAVAESIIDSGAEVLLISGPVHITPPFGCKLIDIKTAQEMHKAALKNIKDYDVFIGCAAVSDYRVENISKSKIKKSQDKITLNLVRNPDIITDIAKNYSVKLVIGFAAETHNLINHAKKKLEEKKLDLIIANEVGDNKGFDKDDNSIVMIDKKGKIEKRKGPKSLLGLKIVQYINSYLL